MHFRLRSFDALTPAELYGILALRQRVFVVEQSCVFLDADGRDQASLHLFAVREANDPHGRDEVVACLRIVSPGAKFDLPSLGRIVTAPEVRGTGLGRAIVAKAIEAVEERWGKVAIAISAQRHLALFYGEFGFAQIGEPYDEDGIPHIDMRRPPR
jgi:ElaA protein